MNPYAVLGVQPGATEEEIKKAYRNLVKKFHPDQYKGTDYEAKATEKLKEINEAYDMLKNGDKSYYHQSGSTSYGTYSGYKTDYGNAGTAYSVADLLRQARLFITQGRYIEAELILRSLNVRNAEWNFLMGNIQWFKGWQFEAKRFYKQAVEMEPDNEEYKAAYERVTVNEYRGYRSPRNSDIDAGDICNCCAKIWCLDTCCECMGGDLCRCI